MKISLDIIAEILSRVPVQSLLRFRWVSKPWLSLISDPYFAMKHLNHQIQTNNFNLILNDSNLGNLGNLRLYSIPNNTLFDETKSEVEALPLHCPFRDENVVVWGSCHGLLCVKFLNCCYETVCLWNPCTNEFKEIPYEPIRIERKSSSKATSYISYGFGYDPNIDDYKVLRVVAIDERNGDYVCEVKVYTLGTNTWRRIEKVPHWIGKWAVSFSPSPALVNGVLHWERYELGESKSIVGFDLVDGEFKEVPQPDYVYDKEFVVDFGGVLGGCLSLVCRLDEVHQVDVWVMKNYGVKESWTKLFTITRPVVTQVLPYLRPLCFSKTGEVLLLLTNDRGDLVVYDPEHANARTLTVRGVHDVFLRETFVESLVSFKGSANERPREENKRRRVAQ